MGGGGAKGRRRGRGHGTTTAVVPAWARRRGMAAWDVAVAVAAPTTAEGVAGPRTRRAGRGSGGRGPPVRRRPRDGRGGRCVDVASVDVAASPSACGPGRGREGGKESGGLPLRTKPREGRGRRRFRRGGRAVERGGGGASRRTRPWDDGEGRCLCRRGCVGRPCGMSHRTDETAGWPHCHRRERRRGSCLHAGAQGNFCSALTWPGILVASVDAAGATVDIQTSDCTSLV